MAKEKTDTVLSVALAVVAVALVATVAYLVVRTVAELTGVLVMPPPNGNWRRRKRPGRPRTRRRSTR